jgi:hypothetical protein
MEQPRQTETRKQWRKPALIVLVRRKPEEAVLVGCKSGGEIVPVNWPCNASWCENEVFS